MTKTLTEPTSYQAAWDEESKRHKRFSRLVYFSFGAVLIAVIAGFGFGIVGSFTILGSEADAEVKRVAARNGGALAGGLLLSAVILGMIYDPFNRAVGWSEWSLGKRPADDFKPREIRIVTPRIEQIDADTRIFHIPGLHSSEDYSFKVIRKETKRRFRDPVYSYQITSATDKNWIHMTLDSSLFRNSSEEEIQKVIVDHISQHLEEKTDYFKELNYTI